ncbi:GIY-YIG nuclease family protein [Candidatus Scalindua japonica]|nr:GIY-YIG nuclease family protein [Candidatus Scalindua japonica]
MVEESIQKGGIYKLVIELSKNKEIKIGKLGTFVFPKGYYVYTGSAQNGLEKRINRHLSSDKKFHWHIDYLLAYAKVINVLTYVGKKDECRINSMTGQKKSATRIVKKFGSSDCDCVTHLYYFKNIPTDFTDSC